LELLGGNLDGFLDFNYWWHFSIGCMVIWYYSSLGKRINQEEKEAGKNLSYEINPFTGSAKSFYRNGN